MRKHELAEQLRRRQHERGLLDRDLMDALSDDEIIDSYMTCVCGQRRVTARQLRRAIRTSETADAFLANCNRIGNIAHSSRTGCPFVYGDFVDDDDDREAICARIADLILEPLIKQIALKYDGVLQIPSPESLWDLIARIAEDWEEAINQCWSECGSGPLPRAIDIIQLWIDSDPDGVRAMLVEHGDELVTEARLQSPPPGVTVMPVDAYCVQPGTNT